MPRIENYALIGDTQTAALVSNTGWIDWLCLPRFDSGACFAALLGDEGNGCWGIAPVDAPRQIRRRYRENTLVLEIEVSTAAGRARLIAFRPPRERAPDVVRIVEGLEGSVPMRMDLVLRFDYGSVVPWVRRGGDGLHAVAGAGGGGLRTTAPTRGR